MGKYLHSKFSIRKFLSTKSIIEVIAVGMYFTKIKISNAIRKAIVRKILYKKVGENLRIASVPNFLYPSLNIHIGDNVVIGKFLTLQTVITSAISIGDRVSINNNCTITALFGITIGDGDLNSRECFHS